MVAAFIRCFVNYLKTTLVCQLLYTALRVLKVLWQLKTEAHQGVCDEIGKKIRAQKRRKMVKAILKVEGHYI